MASRPEAHGRASVVDDQPILCDPIIAEDVFTVERIVKHRGSGWSRLYYVKWEGYPASENTWVHRKDFYDRALCQQYDEEILRKRHKIESRTSKHQRQLQVKKDRLQEAQKKFPTRGKNISREKNPIEGTNIPQEKNRPQEIKEKQSRSGGKANDYGSLMTKRHSKPSFNKSKIRQEDETAFEKKGGSSGKKRKRKPTDSERNEIFTESSRSGSQRDVRCPKISDGKRKQQILNSKLGWECEELGLRRSHVDIQTPTTDEYCSECLTGGSLICCDNCPRLYHRSCLKEKAINEEWPAYDLPAKETVWICRECIELCHTRRCSVTGARGTDEVHLLPCKHCPRAVVPRLWTEKSVQRKDILTISFSDGGELQCSRCCEADSVPIKIESTNQILKNVAKQLHRLPLSHWGSIIGTRIESVLAMEGILIEQLGKKNVTWPADQVIGDIADAQSRLDFLLQSNECELSTVDSTHSTKAVVSPIDKKNEFLSNGFVVLPEFIELSAPSVSAAHAMLMERYNTTMHTILQLDLLEELDGYGFRTFKKRGTNRFDITVPELDAFPEMSENAPWLPFVREILGDGFKRLSTSCVLSMPGSTVQDWHSDGQHMNAHYYLPPHCVNVFVPLVDLSPEIGATEFVPGSHFNYKIRTRVQTPCYEAGQVLIFDHRTKHRGMANTTDVPRPLLYITYAKQWFVEVNDIGLDKSGNTYKELPELIPLTSSREARTAARSR